MGAALESRTPTPSALRSPSKSSLGSTWRDRQLSLQKHRAWQSLQHGSERMSDSYSQGSEGEGTKSRHAGQDLDNARSEWEVETQTQGFGDQPLESSPQSIRVRRRRSPPRPPLPTWAPTENKKD